MRQLLLAVVIVLIAAFSPAGPAGAAEPGPPDQAATFASNVLGGDESRIALMPDGGLGWRVVVNGETRAYLGSTWDIARTAGYSGRPVDVLVLVGADATILGTRLVRQEEPVLTLGISPERIGSYVTGFAGYDLKRVVEQALPGQGLPDAIAGATITSGVIKSGILRTARSLALHNGLLAPSGSVRIDVAPGKALAWDALLANEVARRLTVTVAEADAAFASVGNADPASSFIDLYVAIADPPPVGASLLGEALYSELFAGLGPGDHLLFVGANGLYSFKGTEWRKSGAFERIEIVQGPRTIQLLRGQHRAVDAGLPPDLREKAIFVLPASTGFDAARPFTLSLLAKREDATARFALDYQLPKAFLVDVPTPEQPLWQQNWRSRIAAITITMVMLLALYFILIFQNQIAARPPLYRAIRLGYLMTTLVALGGFLGAQLSVVHVLTFAQAIRTEFSWETFLLDPVIFIIWGWVAVALLFWGRVYCGWLCPFGALQELLNLLAQRLGVKQFSVPFMLHERLWPIKYIIFLGLFAASLASMTMAFQGAEAEPFKTVITFRFMREWPFVLYALALLAAGLFVERFYCRYLCPLGAALAIPARLRMFEWLKRRPQCGRECRICSTKCPVQAIHPEGHINPNECVYCLNCQTLYYDEHICPPLKARAARRANFPAPGGAAP